MTVAESEHKGQLTGSLIALYGLEKAAVVGGIRHSTTAGPQRLTTVTGTARTAGL